jgi:hypothetical protein
MSAREKEIFSGREDVRNIICTVQAQKICQTMSKGMYVN